MTVQLCWVSPIPFRLWGIGSPAKPPTQLIMNTQLTVLDSTNEITVFDPKSVKEITAKVKEEVESQVFDVTTKKGRADSKSLSHKVSKTKKCLSDLAKKSIEEHKTIVDVNTKARRIMEKEFDEIRDSAKAEALEWEDRDEKRIQSHKNDVNSFMKLAKSAEHANSEELKEMIDVVKCCKIDHLEEFQDMGRNARIEAVEHLGERYAAKRGQEEQAAELKKLRAEKAKKDAEEAKVRAEKEKAAVEARVEREKKAAATEAVRKVKEAAKRKSDAEAAKKQRAAEKEADRVADQNHRKRIKVKIIESMMIALTISGITLEERHAAFLVDSIINGEIPHVTINF